jgi:sulfite reductase (ferredoxin)
MGRKFKISFSSGDDDSAFGFMHDLGFIPKIKTENGKELRGFKVFIAGGLGAQAFMAFTAYDFLPEDQIIPFTEAVIRVFDRYGERTKRNKARLKYLVNGIGFEKFMSLVEGERKALKVKSYTTDRNILPESAPSANANIKEEQPANKAKFEKWVKTNVFEQKQKGYYGVNVRVFLGDMPTDQARLFAAIVKKHASEDIRITVNQGFLLKFVKKESLAALHNELDKIGLGEAGFDSLLDITACPGTDTCNLGISSSTGMSAALEKMLEEEFPDMAFEKNIKIKISGCMNACAQHTIANIGFHGSSIKNGAKVLPAMQLMLGGGMEADGSGSLADKVVKLPSKKCPEAVRRILKDYEENSLEGEYFNNYFRRMTAADKIYFYKMLKPLSDVNNVIPEDYIDYGHTEQYETLVGVGECAGAMLDLVTTLISETEDKSKWAQRAFDRGAFADSIYSSYTTFISGAKAMLISETIQCNTQIGILNDFDEHFVKKGTFNFAEGSFHDHVMKMNNQEPSKEFAAKYLAEAKAFFNKMVELRTRQLAEVKK